MTDRVPTALELLLAEGAAACERDRPHYEPIIVSPAQYADPEFMAALKLNFPKGRIVYRPYCDGCELCRSR